MSLQKMGLCCLVEERTSKKQSLQRSLWWTKNEQPGLLHSACLTDTESSYRNHKIILIGLL